MSELTIEGLSQIDVLRIIVGLERLRDSAPGEEDFYGRTGHPDRAREARTAGAAAESLRERIKQTPGYDPALTGGEMV